MLPFAALASESGRVDPFGLHKNIILAAAALPSTIAFERYSKDLRSPSSSSQMNVHRLHVLHGKALMESKVTFL